MGTVQLIVALIALLVLLIVGSGLNDVLGRRRRLLAMRREDELDDE